MSLELPEDQVSELEGGVAAADASIRRYLPDWMSYSGLEETSEGSLKTVFTLPFESTADYEEKAAELLEREGQDGWNLDFTVTNSLLVSGISLQESYTSADLLSWMFEGLYSDEVITTNEPANLHEIGSVVLNFDGVAIPQSYTFDVENVENKGFDAVTIETDAREPDMISRTITYTTQPRRFAQYGAVQNQFLSESTPKGAQLVSPSNGTWEMSFKGAPSAIESSTTTALGGQKAAFKVDAFMSPVDPAMKILEIAQMASCDAVCANGDTAVTDRVTGPPEYSPAALDMTISERQRAAFTYAPPFKSVAASYQFGFGGSVDATVDFVVPRSSVEAVDDGFERLLSPGDAGTMSISTEDESTTYTVKISGTDAADFNVQYEQWVPGMVRWGETGGSMFSQEFGYEVEPSLDSLIGSHAILDGSTSEIVLPFGQWVRNADPGAREEFNFGGIRVSTEGIAAPMSVRSSGVAVGAIVIGILVLAAVAVVSLLLFRHRGTVWSRIQQARGAAGPSADQPLWKFVDATEQAPVPAAPGATVLGLHFERHRISHGGTLLEVPETHDEWRHQDRGSILTIPATDVPHQSARLLDLQTESASGTRPSLLT